MKTLENQKMKIVPPENSFSVLPDVKMGKNVKIGGGGGYVSGIFGSVSILLKRGEIVFLPLLLSNFLLS
jgi:hypothetical protein